MKKLFALILLMTSSAFAADKTAYINTDCANNGDGTASTCAGSPGGAGAYQTCGQAVTGEVAANANLVTMAGILTLDARGAAADSPCVVDGFTTSASFYVRLYVTPANRPPARTWSTSHYRLVATLNNSYALDVRDQHFRLEGAQTDHTATGSGTYIGFAATAGSLEITAFDNIFRIAACATGGGGTCRAVSCEPNTTNAKCTFYNNFAYATGGTTGDCFYLEGARANNGEQQVIYNNTAINCQRGFRFHAGGTGDSLYFKNNVANGNSTAGVVLTSSTFTTDVRNNNITEDGTTGTTAACTFVSETSGTEDLHLASGDVNCQEAGADLTTDPDSKLNVTTDIDGESRPQSTSYDIGADEFATATPTPTPTPTAVARKGQRCTLAAKGQCGTNY